MSQSKNNAIIASIKNQGMTPTQAARKFDVSRQWVYTLLDRYEQGGKDALAPRSRAPQTRPHATNPAVKKRIIELRDELAKQGSDNGAETIAWHLANEGFNVPSPATIHRTLRQAGKVTPEPKKRPKSSYKRFQAELPNECWQADITHATLTDGTRIDILDFLDDHSRYLLAITAYNPCTGRHVAQTMTHLIATYGPPASTLTDNGMVFTSRFASRPGAKNGFEIVLQTHHIEQKNGRPGHPQTQGKIERFHQTLKRWLNARPQAETLQKLQAQLDEFQTWYNTERPHRALGRQTPQQAYKAQPVATPSHTPEQETRTRYDKVDNDGKITVRYAGKLRHLGIGRAHINTPVIVILTGPNATTANAHTGEIIAEHTIDPEKNYQPKIRN